MQETFEEVIESEYCQREQHQPEYNMERDHTTRFARLVTTYRNIPIVGGPRNIPDSQEMLVTVFYNKEGLVIRNRRHPNDNNICITIPARQVCVEKVAGFGDCKVKAWNKATENVPNADVFELTFSDKEFVPEILRVFLMSSELDPARYSPYEANVIVRNV